MGQSEEVAFRFVGFYRGVLGDDAGSRAGSIEEDAVEAADYVGERAGVVGGDDGVANAETVDVAD